MKKKICNEQVIRKAETVGMLSSRLVVVERGLFQINIGDVDTASGLPAGNSAHYIDFNAEGDPQIVDELSKLIWKDAISRIGYLMRDINKLHKF